ncbi:hypothetical protein GCM10025859_46160 [Alicyclobacillus fastidiosus]|nr:hypothetical protein GCM10025859_46160 [Alicyclobacillus fastidiosus]
MPLRILFVIALLAGIAVSFALNKLHRSRLDHMMLGGLCVLTGGVLSLNPHIADTTEASVVMFGLVYFGFVVGVLGFFLNKPNS